MFSNAKSVEINGKEVKSITLKNGGVLYEKLGNTNLGLTYSPSTVYNGDTVNLTATLTNGNISNKEISLLASEPCFDKYFPPQGLSVGEEFCIKQYQGDIVWAQNKRAIFADRLMVWNESPQYTSIIYPIYIKKIDSSPIYEFYHSPNGQKRLLLTETLDDEEFMLYNSILGQSNYTNISTNNNGIASTNIICDNFSSLDITASYNDLSDNVNIIVNDKYNLDLVSDKSILSNSDNDTATLTATLSKNNSALSNEQVLFYDSDKVSLATYYDWLDVFLFTVTSENQGEIIFDTTNAEHNNFYIEDTPTGGGYSNGGRVKFIITDTQVETWRYNSSTDTWTKSMMLYNLPVKIGFSYGTEIISDTAKIPFFASTTTDNNGEATATYNSIGIGDMSITAECMNLQETYELEDCIKVGFNGWTGTFTTGTDTFDYLTPTVNGVSPNITLPSAFKMSYKFKNLNTSNASTGSGLWVIGTDSNNGVLIGHEGTDRRMRIYSRISGSTTVRQTENTVYSYQTWTDAEITFNNGNISITIGGKTISYSLSSAVIMLTYDPYPKLRIAEFKIKAL